MGTGTKEQIGKHVVNWKELGQAERDAEAALRKMKAQLPKIPRDEQSNYKEDGHYLIKARAAFRAEIKKIKDGKSTDMGKAAKLYDTFLLNMWALQKANKKWEALIGLKIITAGAMLPAMAIAWINKLAGSIPRLQKELKELKRLFEKAKGQVREAKWQRAINLGLTAISFALGPVGMLGRASVALGGIGASALNDALLGPDKLNAIGTVNTATGDIAGVHPKLSKAGQKLAGAATAIVSYKFDSDEVENAEKIAKEIEKRLKSVRYQLIYIHKTLKRELPKLLKYKVMLLQLQKKARKAVREAEDADRQYRYLINAIEKK